MVQHSPNSCGESTTGPAELGREKPSMGPGIAARPHVLIAEDHHGLRKLVVQILASDGYSVTETADAFALLNAVSASHQTSHDTFSLIISDVSMPRLTGLQAVAMLRLSGDRTPVIFISALSREAIVEQVQKLDAILIPKPFNREDLRRMVKWIIGTT